MTTTVLSIEGGALAAPPPGAGGVRAYKGIPYAAPPIGPLRWRPPQPVAPWIGLRSAVAFGPNSLQGIVFDDIDPTVCGVSEDCLTLNVWTLASPGGAERLAVMVSIHGGGFVVGSGSEPRYDGTRLAARGIVVVTLNHRLNALGFLAHPELSRESGHGAVRQLRHAGCGCGVVLGETQHSGLRRRSRQGDDRGRIRRLRSRQRADGLAARQRPLCARDRRAARCLRHRAGPRPRSQKRRPRGSPSCARSARRISRSCARRPRKPSSPPRRASVTGRSSTGIFSRNRRPRSSLRGNSRTSR